MCKGTPRFRLVEVKISSVSQTSFSLEDEEVLRTAKKIIAIEAYKVGTVSLAPSGLAVVNNTVFQKSFLTLSTPGTDQVQYKIPLADMDKSANGGRLYMVDIPPIAPTKCAVDVASIASLSATEVFLLGFHYES